MKRFGRDTLIMSAIVLVVILTLTVGALAKTNSGSSSDNQSSAANGSNTVAVTLTDMKIASSQTTFQAGVTYHFVVTNKGAINHELMIMKPMAEGAMDMEQMDKMAVADIESDDLPSGATQTVDVTFDQAYPAGTLEMACHLPGHYAAGMHLSITVNPAS